MLQGIGLRGSGLWDKGFRVLTLGFRGEGVISLLVVPVDMTTGAVAITNVAVVLVAAVSTVVLSCWW